MLRRIFIIFAVVWSLHWESLLAQEWPDELPPEIIGQHFTRIVTAVRAGHLIDPDNGAVVANQIILTQFDPRSGQSEILDVGPDVEIPEGADVIDLSDLYVLPGLVDTHDHLALTYKRVPENNSSVRRMLPIMKVSGWTEHFFQSIWLRIRTLRLEKPKPGGGSRTKYSSMTISHLREFHLLTRREMLL